VVGVLVILSLGVLACNLTQGNRPPEAQLTPTSTAGTPSVTINSPATGSEVAVGQEVLVQSTARDSIGVTRVELRVDGFIVNTVSSEAENGDTTFTVIQTWQPAEAGTAEIEVVAYRGAVASPPASLTLTVRASSAQITATVQLPSGVTQPPNDTVCRARVEVEGLNFRTGPSVNYPIVSVFPAGTLVQITGRLSDNSWWQVRASDLTIGWISSAYTTESGNCSAIPVAVPPASPTPRPATATPTTAPTSTALPGTPTPTVPDLVVASISGPSVLELNASGTVGARYTIRVQNQGTGNSGQFTTSFRRPDGSTIQLPIVMNLAPGQAYDMDIDLTFTASDSYRLEATVDSASQVAEMDEGNNVRTLDVVVTNPPGGSVPGPDDGGSELSIEGVQVVITLAP
jgi:hypothetical protein